MKNKILVEIVVPDIEEKYNVYIPVNRKIGNVVILLCKAIGEMTNGSYTYYGSNSLYDSDTGEFYCVDDMVRNTKMRNGSRLILM